MTRKSRKTRDWQRGLAVYVQKSLTVKAEKVKHRMCIVGIIFPHTGSPTLRQMENRKGEQGEIQLSQFFCSSSVGLLIAVCVCECVFSLTVRSSSQAAFTLSGTDSSKTKLKFCMCRPETTGVCLCAHTSAYCTPTL